MAINNTSLRTQLRTTVPGDTRIVGRVATLAGTPNVTGSGFTFLYSGVVGIYYVFFGTGVTATFDGAGAVLTATNSNGAKRLLSWNLEPQIVDPVANPRSFYGFPQTAIGGGILAPTIGLQIKCLNGGVLANPGNALFDGFAFEIMVANTEITA